ncbi:FYVE zinc finger, Zinc finger, RING/FYVE/PHD-type, Ankyrin repeat-containing domain protein [Artemisia annua]|uniref:FYVE zinc finger, Zinc finger, RING/FYVE/PHD-type, Ankyrin repeat-containing domain protein n=1 Tax=Artemisia annua TaxID=35608 RepID=A0A2U1NSN2_ARTAN|nr:FYVE zinc finger, Zinc finger, RING/FYVE/PHD-type, Ankyrin repeat-containing domain protein [Artemisia annua]
MRFLFTTVLAFTFGTIFRNMMLKGETNEIFNAMANGFQLPWTLLYYSLEYKMLHRYNNIVLQHTAVIVDEYVEDSIVHSDSRSLSTLLLIRDIQSKRLPSKDTSSTLPRVSGFSHSSWIHEMQQASNKSIIISEILDSRTRNHVLVTKISDYVLSNELVSVALAMVAEYKQINRVLEELFVEEVQYLTNCQTFLLLPVPYYASHIVASLSLLWQNLVCGTFIRSNGSNFMGSLQALPQFGIHSLVRVCSNCYNDASRSRKSDGAASVNGVNSVTDSVSRLDISSPSNSDTTESAAVGNPNCTCGMPLCICEPKPVPTSAVPKRVDTTARSRASSSSKPSTGQSANTSSDKPLAHYEVNGEGLREAIKNGDLFSVRKLLSEGVDANYCDKQGLSLLHLVSLSPSLCAAVFNQTEIAFTLMEKGASLDYKNLQDTCLTSVTTELIIFLSGETPLDCAPVTLQFKMKKKMEEIKQSI